jgi:3-phosphoshikimate 1-carboxyvinyltransferase
VAAHLFVDPYVVAPFDGPINANVRIPGSKSITNRALLCAALATGTTELDGLLVADDTAAMIGCIEALGAVVTRYPDNLTRMAVTGVNGKWKPGPITISAHMSGTTARFIAPSLLLGDGHYVLDATESMRERPMGDLIDALVAAGGRIEGREGGRLPLSIVAGVQPDHPVLHVPGDVSSQFLSGLLLSAPCWPNGATVVVDGALVSRPYVDMTVTVMGQFGAVVAEPEIGTFVVSGGGYTPGVNRSSATGSEGIYMTEPDASAASYAFAAAVITGGTVTVTGLGSGSMQGDVRFAEILREMGARVRMGVDWCEVTAAELHGVTVDMADCSDTAQTLAVVAAFADSPTTVTGIGFIRHKETNRINAVVAELQRCGITAIEHDDGFTVHPGVPVPTTVQTYRDHRMAMSFALLGSRSPGISIADPGCVAKTFPEFFEVLESMRPMRPRVNDVVTGGTS